MNSYLIPEDDIELDIKETLKYVMRHWKSVLLAGLILGFLFSSYKVLKIYRQPQLSNEQQNKIESEAEEQRLAYTDESEMYTNVISNINNNVDHQNKYLQNSLIMRIDGYHVPTSRATIIITTKGKDPSVANIVANAYRYDLLEGEYLKKLAENSDVPDVSYLREMIYITTTSLMGSSSFSQSDDGSTPVNVNANQGNEIPAVDTNSKLIRNQISILTIGEDTNQAEKILDGILKEADNIKNTLEDKYEFESEICNRQSYITVNSDILNAQSKFYSNMSTLDSTKSNMEYSRSILQRPTAAPVEVTGSLLSRIDKKSLLKFGCLGFAVGVLLMALCYFVRFACSGVIYSYESIKNRFILRDMGYFDGSENSVEMIEANLINYQDKYHTIAMFGTAPGDIMEGLTRKLQGTGDELHLVLGGNLLSSSQARKKIKDCESVVLVEKKNKSLYSDLRKEIEIINNSGKSITGIVIC